MPFVNVSETKLVGAPAEKVYAILREPNHHVHILPESFKTYRENDDGTISFEIKFGISNRRFTIRTEEAEPNRLFREIQVDTSIATDFILEPHPDGTLVTIKTTYQTPATILGLIEAKFAPGFLRRLYEEELIKLCRYALVAQI